MIIFINDFLYDWYITQLHKEVFMHEKKLPNGDAKILSSMIEFKLPKLKSIVPYSMDKTILNRFQEPIFDKYYYEYLSNIGFDDILKMIIPEYYSGDKFHFYITNNNDFFNSVFESLEKFLKYRFGLTVSYLNTVTDVYELSEIEPSSFSPIGLSEITDTIEAIMSMNDSPMKKFIQSYELR